MAEHLCHACVHQTLYPLPHPDLLLDPPQLGKQSGRPTRTYLFTFLQIKMSLYLGALGYICLYGFKIIGAGLIRYSLMKHLPGEGRSMTTDGFYQVTSSRSALDSRRSNDFEAVPASRTTVFQSTILRQTTLHLPGSSGSRVSFWDTVKGHLILSVAFGLVASVLILSIQSDSQLDGFLLFLSFILLGLQQGV